MSDDPSRTLHASLFGVDPHDTFTGCTLHAQPTFTHTFTTFTRQGPSRSGGSFKDPRVCPGPVQACPALEATSDLSPPERSDEVISSRVAFVAGRPVVVVSDAAALVELAAIVERHDRAAVYAGRVPSLAGVEFMESARRAAALLELLNLPETDTVPRSVPADASGAVAGGRWLTTAQVAEVLGISERAVRKRIHVGTLTAQLRAGRWFIDALHLPSANKEPSNAA